MYVYIYIYTYITNIYMFSWEPTHEQIDLPSVLGWVCGAHPRADRLELPIRSNTGAFQTGASDQEQYRCLAISCKSKLELPIRSNTGAFQAIAKRTKTICQEVCLRYEQVCGARWGTAVLLQTNGSNVDLAFLESVWRYSHAVGGVAVLGPKAFVELPPQDDWTNCIGPARPARLTCTGMLA